MKPRLFLAAALAVAAAAALALSRRAAPPTPPEFSGRWHPAEDSRTRN